MQRGLEITTRRRKKAYKQTLKATTMNLWTTIHVIVLCCEGAWTIIWSSCLGRSTVVWVWTLLNTFTCSSAVSHTSSEGDHTPPAHYVELKTNKMILSERDKWTFERYLAPCRKCQSRIANPCTRHKLLKFWAQSFLAGVPYIVVGFRDENGIGMFFHACQYVFI